MAAVGLYLISGAWEHDSRTFHFAGFPVQADSPEAARARLEDIMRSVEIGTVRPAKALPDLSLASPFFRRLVARTAGGAGVIRIALLIERFQQCDRGLRSAGNVSAADEVGRLAGRLAASWWSTDDHAEVPVAAVIEKLHRLENQLRERGNGEGADEVYALGCALAAEAEEATDGRVWVGEDCTLDGAPATVCGRLNEFGTVACYPEGPRADFSWDTIARVMNAGGSFRAVS